MTKEQLDELRASIQSIKAEKDEEAKLLAEAKELGIDVTKFIKKEEVKTEEVKKDIEPEEKKEEAVLEDSKPSTLDLDKVKSELTKSVLEAIQSTKEEKKEEVKSTVLYG